MARSHAILAMHASMVYVPTCQTCANLSLLFTNVPTMCQLFNLACQRAKGVPVFLLHLPKGVPIFQLFFKIIFQFSNFSIMLAICKFQEYLENSRKLISQTKNLYTDISLMKPCQPKTFEPKTLDVVFNRARGINRTIIRLV